MKRALPLSLVGDEELPDAKRLRPSLFDAVPVVRDTDANAVIAAPAATPSGIPGSVIQSIRALRARFTPDTNTLNAHPRDVRITFNDDIDPVTKKQNHFYLVDGTIYPSVSAAIKHFFPEFDNKKISGEVAARALKKVEDAAKKLAEDARKAALAAGKKPEPRKWLSEAEFAAERKARDATLEARRREISSTWDDARTGGTAKHSVYEGFLQHLTDADYTNAPTGFYRAIEEMAEAGYDAFRCEWRLFDEAAQMAGTADIVFIHRVTGEIILGDWKNTKVIRYVARDAKYVRRGIHPLTADMPDSNYWHYVLQLNFYRYMMEKHYGRTVARILLFNFPPVEPFEASAKGETEDERAKRRRAWEKREAAFDRHELPMLDMAPFFALFPWRADDPRHILGPFSCPRPLVPALAVDACVSGPTTVQRPVRQAVEEPEDGSEPPLAEPLPPGVIWMGRNYTKPGYNLVDCGWKAPYNDFDPVARDLEEYEVELRQDHALLLRVKNELYGKVLVCWCDERRHALCHARLLARYANALGGGVFEIADPVSSPFC